MDQYQTYIHQSKYARWLPEHNRREDWHETVKRYVDFWLDKGHINIQESKDIFQAIYNLHVMPSMRALSTAGPALDRDNMAGYNCSYIAIDHPRAFDEIVYILMNGTGVGFSVERQYINKLPSVADELFPTDTVIMVRDSKVGWAAAFKELISLLYNGQIPQWDMSRLRPKGSPLKTFGGRSSGPEPLQNLFKFTVELFKSATGRKLSSIECHDLVCKIAEIVVVGGVRRSALISLSNLSDDRMRGAKNGQWYTATPHRALANNSAVYTERPDFDVFLKEWLSLHESKAGERGVFSRVAATAQAARNGRRDIDHEFGTNPCSEIILRSAGVCNLTEIVARVDDTEENLIEKVRYATILGTLQSTLTSFRYVRPVWKRNAEEERLLGVSITGILDCPALLGPGILSRLKQVAIDTNKEWADRLGINQSAAITCVKPSGTVSQLVDSSSGIHERFAPYYIRRVRGSMDDPISQLLIDQGVPYEVDVMNPLAYVFSFPQRSPKMCLKPTALGQLCLHQKFEDEWAEHKVSQTVFYSDDEFLGVGQWVWDNLLTSSGVSFLPHTDTVYQQAPYEEIDKDTYDQMVADMPDIDWSLLSKYETEDRTETAQTLACTANSCEI